MRIGLVLDDRVSRPGGIQEYVLGLYDFLERKGHRSIIFTSGRYTQKQKQKRKIVSFGKTFDLPGDAQKGIPMTLGQGKKIKRILAREKPDILHVQGMPGPLGLEFLKYSMSTNVMTFHVAHEGIMTGLLVKPLLPYWKRLEENLHGKIAISEVAADYARRFLPGPYKIIPIGIDFRCFRPGTSEITQSKDRKINLLFVGRLDKRKGLNYLLKAYRHLSEQEKTIRLTIVGDGPEEKKAKNYVKEENLKNVVFTGVVSRRALPSYYATADIFCSPATHGESFGVVLLEAMASGLPVVAFNNSGYRSLFPDFARGLLVPSENVSALTQALLILVTSPSLRRELGRKNRRYVKRFSWTRVGNEILKFYQACKIKQRPKASLSLIG